MAYWMAKPSEIARMNVVHSHNASSQADPCRNSTLFFPEPHQNEIIPQRTVQCSIYSLRAAKIFGEASDFTPPHPRVTEYGMS